MHTAHFFPSIFSTANIQIFAQTLKRYYQSYISAAWWLPIGPETCHKNCLKMPKISQILILFFDITSTMISIIKMGLHNCLYVSTTKHGLSLIHEIWPFWKLKKMDFNEDFFFSKIQLLMMTGPFWSIFQIPLWPNWSW